LGERTLLELEARLLEPIRTALDKYLFAEQVKIRTLAGEAHEIALHGPGASDVVSQALDSAVNLAEPMTCATTRMIGQEIIVWRDDVCGVPGCFLIVPLSAARAMWMHLLTRFGPSDANLGKRPLRAIGWATFN